MRLSQANRAVEPCCPWIATPVGLLMIMKRLSSNSTSWGGWGRLGWWAVANALVQDLVTLAIVFVGVEALSDARTPPRVEK